jgi:hypothetical protein
MCVYVCVYVYVYHYYLQVFVLDNMRFIKGYWGHSMLMAFTAIPGKIFEDMFCLLASNNS